MRRALVLAGSAAGALAFWRNRRRGSDELPDGPDPAEELRAKLAASKAAAVVEPPGEPAVMVEELTEPLLETEPTLGPEDRRRGVHDRARASMEELSSE